MQISIELIPRDIIQLQSELEMISSKFMDIHTVNIPDLLKLDLRSWDACKIARNYYKRAIPHIRAIDFDKKDLGRLIEIINKLDLKEILVLRGDMPQNLRKIYPTNSLELIRKLKENTDIKVYGAIDQYRSSIKDELEYIDRKIDAGADGFFTQPFFDIRYMDIYMEYFENIDVYVGISPVLSERSKYYWEIKNNVVFPKDFHYDMEWNIDFAKKVLCFAKIANSNVYFMPIKTDIDKYLSKVFEGLVI